MSPRLFHLLIVGGLYSLYSDIALRNTKCKGPGAYKNVSTQGTVYTLIDTYLEANTNPDPWHLGRPQQRLWAVAPLAGGVPVLGEVAWPYRVTL